MPMWTIVSSETPDPADVPALLLRELKAMFESSPRVPFGKDSPFAGCAEKPKLAPRFWLGTCAEFAKYGLGFHSCDDSFGVLFKDGTQLILLPSGIDLLYISATLEVHQYDLKKYPTALERKVKHLFGIKRYMRLKLVKSSDPHGRMFGPRATALPSVRIPDRIQHPFVKRWFCAQERTVFELSDGSVQINFQDRDKILLNSVTKTVAYMRGERCFRTFTIAGIAENGCSADLYNRLKEAYPLIRKLVCPDGGSSAGDAGADTSCAPAN